MTITVPSPGLALHARPTRRPIHASSSSIAAIIGVAPIGPVGRPTPVSSWSEFRATFGELASSTLARAVYGFFDNGGQSAVILRVTDEQLASGDWSAPLAALDGCDEVGLIVAPGVSHPAFAQAAVKHCEARRDRMVILDGDIDGIAPGALPRSAFAAAWHPWLEIEDPATGQRIAQPPSGHIAGLFARVEAQRGIHAPPANAQIHGAAGVHERLGRLEREQLFASGVNLLRDDSRRGGDLRAWGARTLSDDAAWRDITIRRRISLWQRAIGDGTSWAVHERNDATLWASLRESIEAFLEDQRDQGRLAGQGIGDAYYVKCDEELNPVEQLGGEHIIIEVGVAPRVPGRFLIFRLCHWPGGLDIAE